MKRVVLRGSISSVFGLFIAMATAFPVLSSEPADSSYCQHILIPPDEVLIPKNGTVKALMILARFPDETSVGAPCTPDPWPSSATTVPTWASMLLEDDVPPQQPGSLTEFYYLMSDGEHELVGLVYPRVIVMKPLSYYLGFPPGERLARANSALIDSVDADPGIDWADFDATGDHSVDFVFVCYRQVFSSLGSLVDNITGASEVLLAEGETKTVGDVSNQYTVHRPLGAELFPRAFRRGPGQTRWIAEHEYGHDLLHIAFSEGAVMPSNHFQTLGPYGIMDGIQAYEITDGIFETYIRWKLGWISPAYDLDLDVPGEEETVTLTDVGANGGDGFAVVRTADPKQYFLVECRDSSATAFTDGSVLDDSNGCQSSKGRSGLVIYHVSEHLRPSSPLNAGGPYVSGWWIGESSQELPRAMECAEPGCIVDPPFDFCVNENCPPIIDIEASGGMFNPTSWAADATNGFDQMSCQSCENSPTQRNGLEPFRPGSWSVFGPFTNPSTNLYWYADTQEEYDDPDSCPLRQQQSINSGLTFYNLEWTTPPGGGAGTIALKVRYDDPESSGPWVLPDGMVWSGSVQVIGDVQVAEGDALEIAEDSRIFAAADQDIFGDDDETSIIVKGRLDVQGTTGHSVLFTSTRDSEFEHYLGSGEDGEEPTDSDWAGISYGVTGCGCTEWGIAASATELSRIEKAHIANSRYGVKIDSLQAPSVVDLSFGNVMSLRHIYLANTDVFIPSGYYASCTGDFIEETGEWKLLSGTHVVASNASANDLSCAGEDELVDIFVGGLLTATGGSGAGNGVYFEPEVVHASTGNDWGGLFLSFYSEGSSLDYVDIGYAPNPIHMFYPTTQSITNSRIHHFGGTGIWAYGLGGADGPTIESTLIERGDGLDLELGDIGVHLDQADGAHIQECRVNLDELESSEGAIGLNLIMPTSCTSTGGATRTLTIENNCIEGPGLDATEGDNDIGVYSEWVCTGSTHGVSIQGNAIDGWKNLGMHFYKPVNDTVSLNLVKNCRRGINVDRRTGLSGEICFRENRVEALESNGSYYGAQTDDVLSTKFGPYVANAKGKNQVAVHRDNTRLMKEVDTYPNNNEILNAEDNYWFTYFSGAFTQLGQQQILQRLQPSSTIDANPFYSSAPSAIADACASSESGPGRKAIVESNDVPPASQPEVVEASARIAGQNPGRGRIGLELAIPSTAVGDYKMEIFAVNGRKISSFEQGYESPGRYVVGWNAKDVSGKDVPSGIYFIRIQGPNGVLKTLKAALIR